MKKILSATFTMVLACSCLPLFAGCACDHDYVETQVEATCTEEGYNLFTCSKCNDSYKGDKVTPIKNHSGVGVCTVCNTNFDSLWKDFIDKNSNSDNNIGVVFEGLETVVLTYNDDYDCLISVMSHIADGNFYQDDMLTLAYNSYDKKWTWLYSIELGITNSSLGTTDGTASGSFSEWSSRSNSLNCTTKTGACNSMSDLLDTIKKRYNIILDKANPKLQECGYNITMENFGLSK